MKIFEILSSEYLHFLYHTVCVSEGSEGGDSPALLTAITLKTTLSFLVRPSVTLHLSQG